MPPPPPPEPRPARYRPISARRRLLIVAVAVATAVVGVMTLLDPPGGVQRKRRLPALCAPGQTEGCVGGKAEVLMLPATPSPSAPASRR